MSEGGREEKKTKAHDDIVFFVVLGFKAPQHRYAHTVRD